MIRVARGWHALTFVVALSALVLQTVLVLIGTPVLADVAVPALPIRTGRLVSYFTIQSNVLVTVVSFLLARNPARDGRAFRVLRLAALVGITVTGIVHYVALRRLLDLKGASALADLGLHVLVPALAVLGWVAFGPRPRVELAAAGWTMAWPLAWLGYTFGVGALTGWYPYPFLNIAVAGLQPVITACGVITGVFVAVIAVVAGVDRWAPPVPRPTPPVQ